MTTLIGFMQWHGLPSPESICPQRYPNQWQCWSFRESKTDDGISGGWF